MSSRPSGGSYRDRTEHSDSRVSRNLRNLAAAARPFHCTASSTSGTTRAGSSAPWQSIPPLSSVGDFPEHKRQRVTAFIQAGRYPSPETVSATRQPSLRTASPSPSQCTSLPSPREVPSNSNGWAPVSESAQEISEIDEDEEFEEEWEYFDGLKEWARDRIVNQDYTKAIEFIKQAMSKVNAFNAMDDLSPPLKAQLALCHFFKGDWRSAEPIVLELATTGLNEVTCNLMHALSLADLFEYSLDSALRFCRMALKGKKHILVENQELIGGPIEADYGTTLALCSTIYHMKGEPIRAEVCHRCLPKGFEYKHPSSELDFIFSHPRLLPAVLGDDIPKFDQGRFEHDCVSPESFFVFGWETAPQGAQSLYRSNSVAPSPLRQRFPRHELYENDTDKVVIEGPSPCSPCSPADSGIDMTADEMPQDNEMQSSKPPNESPITILESSPVRVPLRRRVTRMLNARRLRSTTADEFLEVPLTCPTDPSAISRRWFHNPSRLGTSKSKTLSRSMSNTIGSHDESKAKAKGNERTMRLGLMEVTFRRTARLPESIDKEMNGGRLSFINEEACCDEQLEDRYRTGLFAACQSVGPSRGRLIGLTTEHYGPCPNVGPYTCDDHQQWPEPEHHALLAGNVAMPNGPDDFVTAVEIGNSGLASRTPSHETALFPIRAIIGVWELDATDRDPKTSTLKTDGPRRKTQMILETIRSGTQGRQRLHLDTSIMSQQMHYLAQCRAELPGRLACVLVSLSTAADAEKQAIREELEALVRQLRTCLNDPLLEADLQSIVASLGINRFHIADDEDEFAPQIVLDGEQAMSESSCSQSPLLRDPSAKELLPDADVEHTPDSAADLSDDKSPRPRSLTSRPSFVKGDDAEFGISVPSKPDSFVDVSGLSLLPTIAEGKTLASSKPPEELRSEEIYAPSGLYRAFSFVVGDDAMYNGRIHVADARHSDQESEETILLDEGLSRSPSAPKSRIHGRQWTRSFRLGR